MRVTLSEAWVRLTVFLLILGYLLGSTGVLALVGMMGVVLAFSWLWNREALREVRHARRPQYRRAFPGESVGVEIEVENRKLFPLAWLKCVDPWPYEVSPTDAAFSEQGEGGGEGALSLVLVMRGFAKVRRSFELLFRTRGLYRVGPVMLRSGDPFGLFYSEKVGEKQEQLVVFPKVRPVRELGLRAEDPFGVRSSRRRLFEDVTQPIGVRDYQPQDGFRRIHWPATARTGELQSRVFQPVSGTDLIVCLNVTTLARYWMGYLPEMLEALVVTAASLIMEAYEQGFRVGLISNGAVARGAQPFRIPPGRSPRHLPQILEMLAALTPFVSAPFEQFLLQQAPHLEYGSTLLVVTGITPPELLEALLRLRARTRRCVVFSLAEEAPPFVPGVDVIHRPLDQFEVVP